MNYEAGNTPDAMRICSRVERKTVTLKPFSIPKEIIDASLIQLKKDWKLVGTNEFAPLIGYEHVYVARVSQVRTIKEFRIMPWVWNFPHGSLFTCTLYLPNEKHVLCLPTDSKDFFCISSQPLSIVLVNGSEWVLGLKIDLSEDWDWFQQQWPKYPEGFIPWNDFLAAKAAVLSAVGDPVLQQDTLREGWVSALSDMAESVMQDCSRPEARSQLKSEEQLVRSSRLSFCYEGEGAPTVPYYRHCTQSWEDGTGPIISYRTLFEELKEAPHHQFLLATILMCNWYSGQNTDCGHRIPSVESYGENGYLVRHIEIDSRSFGDRARSFWTRLPVLPIFWFEKLLGPSNIPVDPNRIVVETPDIEGDLKTLRQIQLDLLGEATTYKQWTIPFGAYVQLQIGSIRALKLYEMATDVICIFVNDKAEFLFASVDQREPIIRFWFTPRAANVEKLMDRTNSPVTSDPLERIERFQLLLGNLAASVIRDFWVSENRETVFGTGIYSKHKGSRLRSDIGKPQIIYIPKIRYAKKQYIPQDLHALDYETRRPHFVSGHLRRAPHASDSQIFLARSLGISVPEGFTFVRPHERGNLAAERDKSERVAVYRSRSAIRWLWSMDPHIQSSGHDEWFAYESQVQRWFEKNRYEVVHLAGTSDGGVNIQAQRGSENLLVQCQYRREKVEPKVIRALLDSLATFPQGSKAVLISNSELTSGARDLALQNGVRFIEGINFAKDLHFTLG